MHSLIGLCLTHETAFLFQRINFYSWKERMQIREAIRLQNDIKFFEITCVCGCVYIYSTHTHSLCAVNWGCKIYQLQEVRTPPPPRNKCLGYDTKQSDGEVPVMLEFWAMQSTPSLPSFCKSTLGWSVSPW